MDEEGFNKEFQHRLQVTLGEQMFNNLGQGLRLELLAKELALANAKIAQLQPKDEKND